MNHPGGRCAARRRRALPIGGKPSGDQQEAGEELTWSPRLKDSRSQARAAVQPAYLHQYSSVYVPVWSSAAMHGMSLPARSTRESPRTRRPRFSAFSSPSHRESGYSSRLWLRILLADRTMSAVHTNIQCGSTCATCTPSFTLLEPGSSPLVELQSMLHQEREFAYLSGPDGTAVRSSSASWIPIRDFTVGTFTRIRLACHAVDFRTDT